MKYVPPYGISDPNAPYVNGDPSIARQGSIPPAEAFEHPMREIVNVITKNNFVPSSSDLAQMLQATRAQYANYAIDTGSVNTLSVAYDPPIGKYTLGLPLRVRVANTNNGGVTIDAGAGRVTCKRPDGSNIQAGDMPAGGVVDLVFDGTAFQMVNYLGSVSTTSIVNNFNNIPYAVDIGTVPNQIIAPFSPAITSLTAGDVFLVKVAFTVTGSTTLTVNALTPRPVKAMSGGDLLQNDITAGDIKLFTYDGATFQISPNPLITANITLNVPSPYATVMAALAAIGRKIIAENVTVTVQLAQGVFSSFYIMHRQAERLVIRGTMKAAGPTRVNFAMTGSDPTSRANDAITNINMLRTRYGTEIWANSGAFGEVCVVNYSNGQAKIYDLLLVGPRDHSKGTSGLGVGQGQKVEVHNVAAWGHGYCGFYAGWGSGVLDMYNCHSCGNTGGGLLSASGGSIVARTSNFLGNDGTGVGAVWWGYTQTTANSYIQGNGQDGANAWEESLLQLFSTTCTNNARYDCASIQNSLVALNATAANTASPYFNNEGNMGAWVVVN